VSDNPLVASRVDTSTAFGGAGVLESVTDLCSSLESGSWVAVGLSGVGAALDVAATVIDPLGSLIGAGLGWLMEHLEPLKGWLNDLTGDAGAVLGFAGTWQNVADAMGAAGDELSRVVRADLEAMTGASIAAYAAYADGLADRIRATGGSASAIGGALKTCAMVVQVVHDLVRDTLASLVGSIISWAAEAVFTLGLATPVIVGQVSTRVSSLATKVGRSVTDVISSAKSLKNLLEALQDVLRRLASGVRAKLPGGRAPKPGPAGRGGAPHPISEPWDGPPGLHLSSSEATAVDALRRAAADAEPAITEELQRILSRVDGATMPGLDFRLKGADSLYRKVATDLADLDVRDVGAALARIKDAVRYTAQMPEGGFTHGVESVVKQLTDAGHAPVSWKNTFGQPGYQGINSAWRSPDGQVFELQFHTPTSFDVKMAGHDLYEAARLPHVEPAEARRLEDEMRRLFSTVPTPPGVRSLSASEIR